MNRGNGIKRIKKINKMKGILASGLMAMLLLPFLPLTVRADIAHIEMEGKTGNQIIIEDRAGLFAEDDLIRIEEAMSDLDSYHAAALVTIESMPSGCRNLKEASRYYFQKFFPITALPKDRILFLIDARSREAYIYCPDGNLTALPKSQANNIIDRISFSLLAGHYTESTVNAFHMMKEATLGKKITSPMRFLCNGILALIVALLINLAFVLNISKLQIKGQRENLTYSIRTMNPGTPAPKKVINTRKIYSPQNKLMEEKER